ncbi:phage antirepressor protein, partial [Candidatus Saccharibacteria bacterium]|nr:phage antirepressor protein [Candidatus Saccharibacteria bacterium]
AATTEIARTDNKRGMSGNKDAARRGGAVSGTAREQLEKETGKRVISRDNYLDKPQSQKELNP